MIGGLGVGWKLAGSCSSRWSWRWKWQCTDSQGQTMQFNISKENSSLFVTLSPRNRYYAIASGRMAGKCWPEYFVYAKEAAQAKEIE